MRIIKKLKVLLLLTAIISTTLVSSAQDKKLPAPDKKGGSSLMEALWNRKSERTFANKQLSDQDLSNLLWAACGINRAENGKRTNPTARNKQEVSVYAFFADRVCLYDHKTHSLKTVAKGDHRKLIAKGQDFVLTAPVTLLLVVNLNMYDKIEDIAFLTGDADAGIVSQNINLFCAAYGLSTVTRATMDHEAIQKLLGLVDNQYPALNNPVGYSK